MDGQLLKKGRSVFVFKLYPWATGQDFMQLKQKYWNPINPAWYKRQKFTSLTIFFCSSEVLSANLVQKRITLPMP